MLKYLWTQKGIKYIAVFHNFIHQQTKWWNRMQESAIRVFSLAVGQFSKND